MSLPILTAVANPRWEADLVAAFAAGNHGVEVVRRCVDVADLLAAAAAGLARAVLVSGDLRRLDRDVVTRLDVMRVAVVGVVPSGDEDADRLLRRLGLRHVVPVDAPPAAIAAELRAAAPSLSPRASWDFADPAPARDLRVPDAAATDGPSAAEPAARVIAVWGPTGAPGRTAVAVGIAAELAAIGKSTLLVDADVYGGSIGQWLGVLDESAGLAAGCALATSGRLDPHALAGLALEVGPGLRVLTGITRPDRWPELRPSAVAAVLAVSRSLASYVVVDCGFCLEEDEELSYDTAAPRRNGATLAAMHAADVVVAVGSGDPLSLHRLVRSLVELGEAVPGCTPQVVVNRLRSGPVGAGDPRRHIDEALQRYAGVSGVRYVPMDVAAFDRAIAAGRTLTDVAPQSASRLAFAALAAAVSGVDSPPPPRRRRGLRRA